MKLIKITYTKKQWAQLPELVKAQYIRHYEIIYSILYVTVKGM